MWGVHDMWGHGWWMWIWPILLIALVVAVIWIVSRPRTRPPSTHGDDAEEVLRRRYAAGEIDEDEFRRRRSELGAPRR
jgi:putative membrane protein